MRLLGPSFVLLLFFCQYQCSELKMHGCRSDFNTIRIFGADHRKEKKQSPMTAYLYTLLHFCLCLTIFGLVEGTTRQLGGWGAVGYRPISLMDDRTLITIPTKIIAAVFVRFQSTSFQSVMLISEYPNDSTYRRFCPTLGRVRK